MALKHIKAALLNGDGILNENMHKLPDTPEWVKQKLDKQNETYRRDAEREERKQVK